jgi:hypothetical protein
MRLCTLSLLALLSCGALLTATEPPDRAPPERTPVPLAPAAFADFVGRYQREEMLVLVFRDQGHFFIKVDDRPRVEIFPLSDHEFFLRESPDTLSFERDAKGVVTHFIRHSAAQQLFRRVR